MKNIRRICATLVLTLTLTLTGLAGEIHTPGAAPTPTPQTAVSASQDDPAASGADTQQQDDGADFSTAAAEAALDLLEALLSLF